MKIPQWSTAARFIILSLILYALFTLASAGSRIAAGEELLRQLSQQAEEMERENELLRTEIASAGDENLIADMARRRFGLVLPDEKVFYDPSD